MIRLPCLSLKRFGQAFLPSDSDSEDDRNQKLQSLPTVTNTVSQPSMPGTPSNKSTPKNRKRRSAPSSRMSAISSSSIRTNDFVEENLLADGYAMLPSEKEEEEEKEDEDEEKTESEQSSSSSSSSSSRSSASSGEEEKQGESEEGDEEKSDSDESSESETVDQKDYHRANQYFRDGKRRIDFVLVYVKHKDATSDTEAAIKERKWRAKRWTFEEQLINEGLEIELEIVQKQSLKYCFVKLHAPWKFLARQAESLSIKMPLGKCEIKDESVLGNFIHKIMDKVTSPLKIGEEYEVDETDYFSAPFDASRAEQFIKRDSELVFTPCQRSRMVYDKLDRSRYDPKREDRIGIERLITNGAYIAAYPIHDGSSQGFKIELHHERQLLFHTWATPKRWYKHQPLDVVRRYFGEKIGLYFAWLGYYTSALVPAALIGMICVFYGGFRLESSDFFGNQICNYSIYGNLTMCPVCDTGCGFWKLIESCEYALATHVFDNRATVVFSIFMAIWATLFMEGWKRYLADLTFRWDLHDSDIQQERVRPEFMTKVRTRRINPVTGIEEPYLVEKEKYMRWIGSAVTVLFFLCLVMSFVAGIIIYRVIVSHVMEDHPRTQEYATITTSISAAVLNLLVIVLLSKVYQRLAYKLTELEYPRTESEFDNSYALKVFCFQFINYYSSLFYIAFMKGRFSTVPGDNEKGMHDYRLFGQYQLEQCDPAGCMVELVIQLGIIMVGKQFMNNFMEIILPVVKNWWRKRKEKKVKKARTLLIETDAEGDGDLQENKKLPQWERDLALEPFPKDMLDDYMEMVIQYGFVTLFVAAFPLAPFFAFLNNVAEIRLDAYKYVVAYRRPTARIAKNLGIWTSILDALSRMAVFMNACVIAFTSDFIPRLLYMSTHESMEGYMNWELSYFNASSLPTIDALVEEFKAGVQICRFRDLRLPPCGLTGLRNGPPPGYKCGPGYPHNVDWWHELAAKLAFVLVFEHFVYLVKDFIAYVVPDMPTTVFLKLQRQLYLIRETREEFDRQHEDDAAQPNDMKEM